MTYPKVKFRKSAQQDFKTLMMFSASAKYDKGRGLDWAVFRKYPRLKIHFTKNKYYKIKEEKTLRGFVNGIYNTNKGLMDIALTLHEKNWNKVSSKFFSLVNRLFKNYKWPQGKYIAFGTIWGMYPRFLEDKTFRIPFWHRKPKYTQVIIAHEMLHFIFYDYFYRRYPKYSSHKYNFFSWHVSEIFNTLIQNSPQWVACFKLKSLGYPEHKKIVNRIDKEYHCNGWGLDVLTDRIVKEVQDQKIV